jgi:threonine/homoserine/homoserine lactone efflux protein
MPLDLATLGAFVITAGAIAVSPGPDTMLILRYALTSGPTAGLWAVAGVQIGLVVHTALAAAGVSALIASSPALFRALAVVGAAYLAWLGLRGFRSRGTLSIGEAARVGTGRACRDGILCNVLNPKVIVLFLALYPNFLAVGRGDVSAQVAMLSAVLVAINVAWQVGLVRAAEFARRRLTRPEVQRAVGRLTGAILIALAAIMLWRHAI